MDTPANSRAFLTVTIALAVLLAAAIITMGFLASRPAAATTVPTVAENGPAAGVTVTGTARVEGVPDTLRLDIGVDVVEDSVDAALAGANEAAAALQATLRDNGVAERDIASTQVSIQPQYDYRASTARITGYQVIQTVTAKLRDMETAGEVVGKAAAAGGDATIVRGIAFDLEDNEALLQDARKRAVADAQAKAQEYADASGRRLGTVISISEANVSSPQPYQFDLGASMATDEAFAVPLAPGTQTVRVDISVVYAFG